MLKRVTKISLAALAASLAVMVFSLPLAVKDGIRIYNSMVVNSEVAEQDTVIEQAVTELKMTLEGAHESVTVKQSNDGKIHIKTVDSGFYKYQVDTSISRDNKLLVKLTKVNNRAVTKENIEKALACEVNNRYGIYLEIPESVAITSQESDQLYFHVYSDVEFPNVEVIRSYGHMVTEEESWRVRYSEKEKELAQLQEQYSILEREYEEVTGYQSGWDEGNDNAGSYERSEGADIGYAVQNTEQGLRKEIERYRQSYEAEVMTRKQYEEMTDSLYQQIRDYRREQVFADAEGQMEEANFAQVLELVDSICNKMKVLDNCQIDDMTNRQLYSHRTLTEEEYAKATRDLTEKKLDVQLSIERDLRSLRALGYDWDKGLVPAEVVQETAAQQEALENLPEEKPAVG